MSDWASVRMAVQGMLRSSHALIFGLGIGALVLFGLARTGYPIAAYVATGLFSVCVLGVVGRYIVNGPEQDRAQPSLTYSPQQLQIVNVDPVAMEALAKVMVLNRQPLPPPAGILIGPASDPAALQLISNEQAEKLVELDAADASIGVGATVGTEGSSTA